MAESWAIFGGNTKYSSLGHSAFFGLAMYMFCLLSPYFPFLACVIIGGLFAAFVAFLISIPFLRIHGPYFIIATYGLVEFFKALFLYYEVNYTHTVGRIVAVRVTLNDLYYCLLAVLIFTLITHFIIKKSRFGFGLRGIKDEEEAAEVYGVNTAFYKIAAFTISSFFAGLCGGLLATRWVYIDPYVAFSSTLSFESMLLALLGGATRIEGPVIGSLIFISFGDYLRASYPMYYTIVLGAVLILVIRFLPEGVVEPFLKTIKKIK